MTEQLEFDFAGPSAIDPVRLRRRVLAVTEELLAAARARWPKAEIPRVEVTFKLRGHAAGEADPASGTTNYNAELLERYGDEFIRSIVPHEVAHVVAERIGGRGVRPHGREWRSVMEYFGAEPSVSHGFETKAARRLTLYPYRCRCGTIHRLSKRSHRRFRRGSVTYTCTACRAPLVFAGS